MVRFCTFGLAFTIGTMSTLCGSSTHAADQAPGGCTPDPHGYGMMVRARLSIDTVPPVSELKCSKTRSISNTGHSSGAGLNAYYSYVVSASGVAASARIEGADRNNKISGGSAYIVAYWYDTVTFHTDKLPIFKPGLNSDGVSNPVTPADVITLSVRYKEGAKPDCDKMGNDFFFEGHAVTLAKSIANSTSPLGGDARSIDQCPTDAQITTMETLNGQPASVVATVTVLASATFPLKNSTPGKAHADRSAVKLCFVHPSKFPDLTIQSASGNDYWCP
jgi:hypothetical protein